MSEENESVQLSSPRSDEGDNGKAVEAPIVSEPGQDECITPVQAHEKDEGEKEAKKDGHEEDEKAPAEEDKKTQDVPSEPIVSTDEKGDDKPQSSGDNNNDDDKSDNDENKNDTNGNNVDDVNKDVVSDVSKDKCIDKDDDKIVVDDNNDSNSKANDVCDDINDANKDKDANSSNDKKDNDDNGEKENNFVVVNEEMEIEILPEDCSDGKTPLKWGFENYANNEENEDDCESGSSDYSGSESGSGSGGDSNSEDDDDDNDNEKKDENKTDENSDMTPLNEMRKWKSCSALKVNRIEILTQNYRYPVVVSWATGVKPENEGGSLLGQSYRIPQPPVTSPSESPSPSKSPHKGHHKHKHQGSKSKTKEGKDPKDPKEAEKRRSKSPKGNREDRKSRGKELKEEKKEKEPKEEKRGEDTKGKDSSKESPKPKDEKKSREDRKSRGKELKEEKEKESKESKDDKKPKETKDDKKDVDSKDDKKPKDVKEEKKVPDPKDDKKAKKKPVIFKAPKPIESKKLRFTAVAYSGRGRRKTNEDTHVIIEDLQKDAKHQDRLSFFAVYDGHGGSATSEACKDVVHRSVLDHPLFGAETETAIREGFAQADKDLKLPEGDKSGSTAVVGFLHGKTLYIADIGDSECVLGVQEAKAGPYTSELLSKKHKPTDPDEKARIEKEGGMVVFGRVYGTLAVSRSFGDYEFKHSDGMYVSCEPYIKTRNLSRKDKFVIFACDGLWDKVTYDEAVIHVSLMLGRKKPEEIVESLYELSFGKGSLDNITIVLVLFEWG